MSPPAHSGRGTRGPLSWRVHGSLEVQNRNRDPMAVLDHTLYILAFGLAVVIAIAMLVLMS